MLLAQIDSKSDLIQTSSSTRVSSKHRAILRGKALISKDHIHSHDVPYACGFHIKDKTWVPGQIELSQGNSKGSSMPTATSPWTGSRQLACSLPTLTNLDQVCLLNPGFRPLGHTMSNLLLKAIAFLTVI